MIAADKDSAMVRSITIASKREDRFCATACKISGNGNLEMLTHVDFAVEKGFHIII